MTVLPFAILVFLSVINFSSSFKGILCKPRIHNFSIFMGRAAAVRAKTKARTDGAKAKNNNRYAKKIIQAVKAGGPDPVSNRALQVLIAESKANNVPNDVIERNIKKARYLFDNFHIIFTTTTTNTNTNTTTTFFQIISISKQINFYTFASVSNADTADFKESVFEFYGHGGVGFIINVLTDNDNRASGEIALAAKKNGLKTATSGSVSFNFDKKARLDVSIPPPATGLNKVAPPPPLDEDKLMVND